MEEVKVRNMIRISTISATIIGAMLLSEVHASAFRASEGSEIRVSEARDTKLEATKNEQELEKTSESRMCGGCNGKVIVLAGKVEKEGDEARDSGIPELAISRYRNAKAGLEGARDYQDDPLDEQKKKEVQAQIDTITKKIADLEKT